MSSSLSYETCEPLYGDLRSAVVSDVEAAASGYEWWCEPICFFDRPDADGRLTGNTKLFLLLDEPAVDSFMAHADASKIVECLAAASLKYGVRWKPAMEGSPVGEIANGVPDSNVAMALQSLLEICALMGMNPSEQDREAILAAHRGR